jgi:hypothetical protein
VSGNVKPRANRPWRVVVPRVTPAGRVSINSDDAAHIARELLELAMYIEEAEDIWDEPSDAWRRCAVRVRHQAGALGDAAMTAALRRGSVDLDGDGS